LAFTPRISILIKSKFLSNRLVARKRKKLIIGFGIMEKLLRKDNEPLTFV